MEDTEIMEEISEPEETETGGRSGFSDSAAMQGAVCILIAIAVLAINIASPETGGGLLHKLREMTGSAQELIHNPLEMLIGYLGEHGR